jgi:hypothetical protein
MTRRTARRAWVVVSIVPAAIALAVIYGAVGAVSGVLAAMAHAFDRWGD